VLPLAPLDFAFGANLFFIPWYRSSRPVIAPLRRFCGPVRAEGGRIAIR
jgi:hypothetical protein